MAPNSPGTRSGRSSLLRVRTSKRQSSCIVLTWPAWGRSYAARFQQRSWWGTEPTRSSDRAIRFRARMHFLKTLYEQELLDRLSQLAASPGSKRDETVPAPVKIEDCKLDLAGHTFVDGSGREVRLNRARDRVAVSDGASETRLYQRHRWRSEGFHDEAKSWHGLARAVPARRRE